MSKFSDPEVLAAQYVLIRYYRELLNESNYHVYGLMKANPLTTCVIYHRGTQKFMTDDHKWTKHIGCAEEYHSYDAAEAAISLVKRPNDPRAKDLCIAVRTSSLVLP